MLRHRPAPGRSSNLARARRHLVSSLGATPKRPERWFDASLDGHDYFDDEAERLRVGGLLELRLEAEGESGSSRFIEWITWMMWEGRLLGVCLEPGFFSCRLDLEMCNFEN